MIKTHAALDDQEVQQDRNQRVKKQQWQSLQATCFCLWLISPNSPSAFHSVCIFVLHTASFQPVFLISFPLLLHIVSTPKKP